MQPAVDRSAMHHAGCGGTIEYRCTVSEFFPLFPIWSRALHLEAIANTTHVAHTESCGDECGFLQEQPAEAGT
eukprot:5169471-Amphidinium_carterae.1